MTKDQFKADLTLRLLDDILIQKNTGTEEEPNFELDSENLKNHLFLIQKLADFAFNGE